MLFSTPTFLFLFLPLVLLLDRLGPRPTRNAVLLLASLLFYAWGEQEVVALMLSSIAVNFGVGQFVGKSVNSNQFGRAKWGVAVAACFNLGLLISCKYSGFLLENINRLLAARGLDAWSLPEIPLPLGISIFELPIGISFFTFQALSYVIDVYRREAEMQKSPIDFGLYIALFPQLIAGPIVRYRDVAEQLRKRVYSRSEFATGVRRFIVGLAKKTLLADTLGRAAEAVFDQVPSAELTAPLAWVGAVSYSLRIYFDFSAYSDMAIGLGQMLGLRFRENFLWPYAAGSITEFWRRWHISLSSWFRDYLYIPLGGNRKGAGRTAFNLLLVFILCGLWHGANWTFLVWGLYHGAFLIMERMGLKPWIAARHGIVRSGYTLLVVLVGWVFFRAANLEHALAMLRAMIGLGSGDGALHHPSMILMPDVVVALVLGVIGAGPLFPHLARRLGARELDSLGAGWRPRLALPAHAAVAADLGLLILLCTSLFFVASVTSNPFIYFRF